MNIAAVFIAYFGIKETQFHPTLVRAEDNTTHFSVMSTMPGLNMEIQRHEIKHCCSFAVAGGHSDLTQGLVFTDMGKHAGVEIFVACCRWSITYCRVTGFRASPVSVHP